MDGLTVAAVCTRCKAPLRIVDDLPPAVDINQSFKAVADSYVVVPTSDPSDFSVTEGGALPSGDSNLTPFDKVSRIEQIIALASGQHEVDHPVCEPCLVSVIEEVNRQVRQADEEQRTYQKALDELEAELAAVGPGELEQIDAELRLLAEEEERLKRELAAADAEERELKLELEAERQQSQELDSAGEEFWQTVAKYQVELSDHEEEMAATTFAVRYATTELQRLKRTNVLNDVFHISHEGSFGTINRFRIGRLPEVNVPWDEINSAWGQACLLLDALIKKCQVPTSYRLLPRGSFSQIQAGADVLELYSSEGGLSRFFSGRRFDLAMAAFLACLAEVVRFLQREPGGMKLPFRIDGDKVGNFSIRVQFNQDERWTKALKFMLIDLKWITAFVESRERQRPD